MLTLKAFKSFWNSKTILTPAEKFKHKLYRDLGLYTRTTAKNSMIDVQVGTDAKKIKKRDRKVKKAGFSISRGEKVSLPGSAAFSRVGLVKKFIYSAADKDGVVIGPMLLSGVKSKGAVEKLEHGGIEQITVTDWIKGQKTRASVSANYKARPTMGLAFDKAIKKKMPGLIAGGIMREA